jgi:2,4-dienoyl-CoA reductase-like NADH-dependent reductase (Old Yellow Enzyme family)
MLKFQVPFAEQLKATSSIPISAVGLITSGKQAEEILQKGQADIITVARHFLRDPSLVFNWAQELDSVVNVPVQYQRAYTRMMTKPEDKKD